MLRQKICVTFFCSGLVHIESVEEGAVVDDLNIHTDINFNTYVLSTGKDVKVPTMSRIGTKQSSLVVITADKAHCLFCGLIMLHVRLTSISNTVSVPGDGLTIGHPGDIRRVRIGKSTALPVWEQEAANITNAGYLRVGFKPNLNFCGVDAVVPVDCGHCVVPVGLDSNSCKVWVED